MTAQGGPGGRRLSSREQRVLVLLRLAPAALVVAAGAALSLYLGFAVGSTYGLLALLLTLWVAGWLL